MKRGVLINLNLKERGAIIVSECILIGRAPVIGAWEERSKRTRE